MATTKEDIIWWLKVTEQNGKKVTHMLVVWDSFDFEGGDYPVYVVEGQDVQQVIQEHGQNMQKVMEVYSYAHDLEAQLNEHRAWHVD